jgi:hypothetical protein
MRIFLIVQQSFWIISPKRSNELDSVLQISPILHGKAIVENDMYRRSRGVEGMDERVL